MKYLISLGSFLFYFGVATFLAEVIILAIWYREGKLHNFTAQELFAVIYGVDQQSLLEIQENISPSKTFEPFDLEDLYQARTSILLDFDLREASLEKANMDLDYFETALKREVRAYDKERTNFESELTKQLGIRADENLVRLRDTLANIEPFQAKEQLVKMMRAAEATANQLDAQEIRNDVVVIVKTLSMDRRKKIIAEFQSPEERKLLQEIMRDIREGIPELPLIRATESELRRFEVPNKNRGSP